MKVVTPLHRPVPVVPAVHQALRRGVDEEVFPGGAAAVYLEGKLVHLSCTGDAQLVPEKVAMKPEAVHATLAAYVATGFAMAGV